MGDKFRLVVIENDKVIEKTGEFTLDKLKSKMKDIARKLD